MTFASPLWLLAVLLVPLFGWMAARTRKGDHARIDAFVTPSMFERIGKGNTPRTENLRTAAIVAGTVLLILALARPQWGIVRERVERTGVDVALVLDTSLSMSVEDVSPNRFFLAKQAMSSLMMRLGGDRFSLVAFEGEAYPLVPLTLDADAVSLFLETIEPGFVPAPGSNLLSGINAGLATFVDPSRVNRVIVLVSDGEDLEDSLDASIAAAKKAGVVVHTIGVGSAEGGPVPDTDSSGARNGYKLENGDPVISRLNTDTLVRLAQDTGGKFMHVSSNNATASAIAAAIEGLENRQAASEFSFRKKERFQIPLSLSLLCYLLGFFGPILTAWFRRHRTRVAAACLLLGIAPTVHADIKDEILARPSRETNRGIKAYESGAAAEALAAFEKARQARPTAVTRFNEAVAQAKAGRAPDAIETFTALSREQNDLGFESQYNLGNALLGARQLPAAVAAYRDALRLRPDDARARRNLEIALRQMEQQKNDQKQQDQEDKKDQKDQKKDQDKKDQQKQSQPKASPSPEPQPKSQKERENERFQKETGMSKDRAMQLLKALEQNEKMEQKKKLEAERAKRRKGKDW